MAQLRDTFCDGSIAKLAARLDKQPSYVSRMLFDEDRAGVRFIGEGMAREIEAKFGLPQYAMDSLDGDLVVTDEAGAHNSRVAAALESIDEEELASAINVLQKLLQAKRVQSRPQVSEQDDTVMFSVGTPKTKKRHKDA
ncbi:hypothetical protein [Paraburkholderia sp. Clong3]|uniref:hypothetical protein n=1 Tax=Paraburkholderia sp. Clong3 TaxID=2991061 RepID=UPI003D21B453